MRNLIYIATVLLLTGSVWPQGESGDKQPEVVRLVADSGIDLNGDGYFEHLAVTIAVDIASAGEYNLCCRVLSADGQVLADVPSINETEQFWRCRTISRHWGRFGIYEHRICEPGTERWEFKFSGQQIYWSGVDGHYVITVDKIDRERRHPIKLDKNDHDGPDYLANIARLETSRWYDNSKFREAPQILDVEENPVDVTGDGLYDYLDLKIAIHGSGDSLMPTSAVLYGDTIIQDDFDCSWLEGREPGGKSETGSKGPPEDWGLEQFWALQDRFSHYSSDDRDTKAIAILGLANSGRIGPDTLTGRIKGYAIRNKGIDGSYVVRVMLGDWCLVNDCKWVLTREYRHDEFTDEVLTISSTSEPIVDTDKDGLRDCLRLEFEVDAVVDGDFVLQAWLEDTARTAVAFAKTECKSSRWEAVKARIDFDGDAIAKSGVDGPYRVRLSATGKDDRGKSRQINYSHLTESCQAADFRTPAFRLTGRMYDYGKPDPQMPPYSQLKFTFYVIINVRGVLTATADLVDSAGTIIQAGASSTARCEARGEDQPYQCTLTFNGGLIERNGTDGPFYVKNLRLVHSADSSRSVTVEDMHTTKDYSHTDFICRPGIVIESVRDWGIDADGNGLFDSIAVELSMTCCRDGECRFKTQWRTGPLKAIAGHDTCFVDIGQNVCTVSVDASYLGLSDKGGPYRLALLVSLGGELVETSVTTSKYHHTEFEGARLLSKAAIEKSHEPERDVGATSYPVAVLADVADRGIDIDRDGLFDSLQVGIRAIVADSAEYRIHAVLVLDSGGIYPMADTVALGPGEHIRTLAFDGSLLGRSGRDGPYRVNVVVFRGAYPLDNAHYWTKAYKYTEFRKQN